MIPNFGGKTGTLPRGIHPASWTEVETTLGYNARRKELLSGLLAACHALKVAGVTLLYIDGSFATKKANPGDWDACYETANVDPDKLDPVFLDFTVSQPKPTQPDWVNRISLFFSIPRKASQKA